MSKVMLIDDDRVVIDLLATLLQMEGFEVITNTGVKEIIDTIRNQNPDVILMDVYLNASPNTDEPDGLNILKAIRDASEFSETKVIMTSGINFQIDSEDLGADAFLHKPYMPEELISIIKQLLS
jgi:CheY-like chemotaxis protein